MEPEKYIDLITKIRTKPVSCLSISNTGYIVRDRIHEPLVDTRLTFFRHQNWKQQRVPLSHYSVITNPSPGGLFHCNLASELPLLPHRVTHGTPSLKVRRPCEERFRDSVPYELYKLLVVPPLTPTSTRSSLLESRHFTRSDTRVTPCTVS